MNKIDRRTAMAAGLASASIISTGAVFAAQEGGSAEEKLRQLGIELPKVATPSANFIPAARLGNLVFLAGTGPRNPDGSRPRGKVGREVTLEEAQQHARNVGLQLLAALREEIGSLDKVVRFGRVFGMVNAVPEFGDHPKDSLCRAGGVASKRQPIPMGNAKVWPKLLRSYVPTSQTTSTIASISTVML
jgi:enamine deaminase RidA (YjgF/YER057c/UK114 family)